MNRTEFRAQTVDLINGIVQRDHGQIGPVLAGQQAPTGDVTVPDWTETQTAALLGEAGLGADEIERLLQEGVVA